MIKFDHFEEQVRNETSSFAQSLQLIIDSISTVASKRTPENPFVSMGLIQEMISEEVTNPNAKEAAEGSVKEIFAKGYREIEEEGWYTLHKIIALRSRTKPGTDYEHFREILMNGIDGSYSPHLLKDGTGRRLNEEEREPDLTAPYCENIYLPTADAVAQLTNDSYQNILDVVSRALSGQTTSLGHEIELTGKSIRYKIFAKNTPSDIV